MKYRKKPVVIEAMKWDGTNIEEIKNFAGDKVEFIADVSLDDETIMIEIKTLEGAYVSIGDFIIKDIKGELYPCKPDIFEEIYEAVEEQTTEQKRAFETLDLYRRKLTLQQYKTLKGQIEAGDTEGFYKGIRKIFRIKSKSYDEIDII